MAETYRQKLKREHVQRLSFESAKREKIVIYAACLIITALAFFGGQKIEWFRQSLIWIMGMSFGAALCLIIQDRTKPTHKPTPEPTVIVWKKGKYWTDEEISLFVATKNIKLSKRTLNACRQVLVGNRDPESEALHHEIFLWQLKRALWKFQKETGS
jgi:hypothetical protein